MSADTVWLLMLFSVPDRHGGLVQRLGFKPTKKKRTNWWRTFDPKIRRAKDDARAVMVRIRSVSIGNKWIEVPRNGSRKPNPPRGNSPHGSQRRTQTPPISTKIINLQIAQENRLARDALKIAREKRRQAELLAQTEIDRIARIAVRRSRGEL